MLREWLVYLLTPCSRPEHLKELIAIEARYRRNRTAWAPHLENSKAAILRAAGDCSGRAKVTLYGSGLLLDVPLAELSPMFKEVVLVDVFHMPSVRRSVRGMNNVRLIEADVTRGLPEADADLVVSCNMLSQLPLFEPERGRELLADHMATIAAGPGSGLLLTEIERQWRDNEVTIESEDPLMGAEIPDGWAEWYWNIAPRPEISPEFDLRLKVRAVFFGGG